jgi:hypothetical protein
MEFLIGMAVGWFTMPYVLVGTLLFFSGFPVLFWGYDIYKDDRWRYNFLRTVFFMVLTGAVLHFFTPFSAVWLITGDFWGSVLRLWLYIVGYIAVGLIYSYVRFYFYAHEFNRRRAQKLGSNPSEADKDRAYRSRLSGYGSRVSLILKWIFHWPWSLLSWLLTDLVKNLLDWIFDGARALFGRGFGAIARANEPDWMKERERQEREATKATSTKS